jgi:hypothetical protein
MQILLSCEQDKIQGAHRTAIHPMEDKGVSLRLVSTRGRAKSASRGSEEFYEESYFNEMLNLEKKRFQRSRRPLMLIRLDISGLKEFNPADGRRKLQKAVASGIRETDVCGWYRRGTEVGIVFTELKSAGAPVRDVLIRRVAARLVSQIDPDVLSKIKVTCHTFPEGGVHDHAGRCCEIDCRKDVAMTPARRDLSSRIRILRDVVGNLLMT